MNTHDPASILVEREPDGSFWTVKGELGEVLYSDGSQERCEGVADYLQMYPPVRTNLLEGRIACVECGRFISSERIAANGKMKKGAKTCSSTCAHAWRRNPQRIRELRARENEGLLTREGEK